EAEKPVAAQSVGIVAVVRLRRVEHIEQIRAGIKIAIRIRARAPIRGDECAVRNNQLELARRLPRQTVAAWHRLRRTAAILAARLRTNPRPEKKAHVDFNVECLMTND